MPAGPLRRDRADWLLEVRVQPRASRTGFAGAHGARLRIRLQAPPVDGKANEALLAFLAGVCGLPRNRVTLERGAASRDKCVRLHGVPAPPPALLAATGEPSDP
jgi:uncharacterized protein